MSTETLPVTMKNLVTAWGANVGRQIQAGEAEEFRHAFGTTPPDLVRRAIDEYATSGAEFMRLAGLRSIVARLCYAARAADPTKSAEADRNEAQAWFARRGWEAAGFRFDGTGGLDALTVRDRVAQHQGAWQNHTQRPALAMRDPSVDAREVMRLLRNELHGMGFVYVGHDGGPNGLLEVYFGSDGWYFKLSKPSWDLNEDPKLDDRGNERQMRAYHRGVWKTRMREVDEAMRQEAAA